MNLYGFVGNKPVNSIDLFGLADCEVLVIIFTQKDDDQYLSGQVKNSTLRTLKDIHKNLVWKLSSGSAPSGSKPGKQRSNLNYKAVYHVHLELEKAKSVSAALQSLNPLGYGEIGSFEAVVWPNRVMHQYKMYDGNYPSGWRSSEDRKAWDYLGGFIVAHEVLHSVGATHLSDSDKESLSSTGGGYVMDRANLGWLVTPPIIHETTKKTVIDELEVE